MTCGPVVTISQQWHQSQGLLQRLYMIQVQHSIGERPRLTEQQRAELDYAIAANRQAVSLAQDFMRRFQAANGP